MVLLNYVRIFNLYFIRMNTKLTLSLEKEIIEQAKQFAKEHGKSLSQLIENYLLSLIQNDINQILKEPSVLYELKGSFKENKTESDSEVLEKALKNKYLKK